jgi:actin-related protein 3
MADKNAVVIDNGTGYTKMGYAGNIDPDFVIPTAIADLEKKSTLSVSTKNDEYNFYIGNEAIRIAKTSQKHKLTYPMQNGIIEEWDLMEKFWHQSIYNYLKCDPQEHYFLLTEPPMNPPENRENIAEIFFETFNVPGLYIGVQAVFALMGCQNVVQDDKKKNKDKNNESDIVNEEQINAIKSLTGVVVDSGDGVTHVVPICDGFVLGSNIKHIPIAGRKITKFMEQMIRDRGEKIPTEDLYYATMDLKEKHGYLARDILLELQKFDTKNEKEKIFTQSKKFLTAQGIGKITNMPYKFDVGYEIFLGPESFFSPEIIDKNWKTGLDETIDLTIQQCPIDYRRKLYSNIVFSGGSTQFKNFDKRLNITLQDRVDKRLAKFKESDIKPKEIKVNVTNSLAVKHIVWLGGSTFSSTPNFKNTVHTREEYLEKGPSCCRFNPVFGFS